MSAPDECRHGRAIAVPTHSHNSSISHCAFRFTDAFLEKAHRSIDEPANLRESFKIFPEVWSDDNNRKMVIDILISMGTNSFLREIFPSGLANCIAKAIVILEHYNGMGDFLSASYDYGAAVKLRDLRDGSGSSRRDNLKFSRKESLAHV